MRVRSIEWSNSPFRQEVTIYCDDLADLRTLLGLILPGPATVSVHTKAEPTPPAAKGAVAPTGTMQAEVAPSEKSRVAEVRCAWCGKELLGWQGLAPHQRACPKRPETPKKESGPGPMEGHGSAEEKAKVGGVSAAHDVRPGTNAGNPPRPPEGSDIRCTVNGCERSFGTYHGRDVHEGRSHPTGAPRSPVVGKTEGRGRPLEKEPQVGRPVAPGRMSLVRMVDATTSWMRVENVTAYAKANGLNHHILNPAVTGMVRELGFERRQGVSAPPWLVEKWDALRPEEKLALAQRAILSSRGSGTEASDAPSTETRS